MKKDRVIVEACVACSNMYGVTNELTVCEVDVKGMGVPLTRYNTAETLFLNIN